MELGASEAEAEAALEARKPAEGGDFELWPENLEAFEIFCALETQWRIASGFAVIRIGLIYSEATREMRERGIKRERRQELMGDLRAMERAALPVLNKRGDDDG